jgi:hypothetical protein
MPRRADAARSRSAVLWGLAAFAAAQLALALLTEFRWPGLRDSEEAVKLAGLLDCRARTAGRPLLLALGSSRILMGFRPDSLPHAQDASGEESAVYNYGRLGLGPVREVVTLRGLLARGLRPDYLLLECWAPFLDVQHGTCDAHKIELSRYAWSDRALLRRYEGKPRRFDRDWLESHLVPWHACRQMLRDHVATYGWDPSAIRRDSVYATGWMGFPRYPPDRWEKEAVRFREWYAPSVRDWRLCPVADRALRELLTLCREERIRVALVVLPEESSFRAFYSPQSEAAARAYFQGVAAEYHVPLADARAWVPDERFCDTIHLDPEGANLLTERLSRELLRPLLAGPAGSVATAAGRGPSAGAALGPAVVATDR